jgi:hypothetical protein
MVLSNILGVGYPKFMARKCYFDLACWSLVLGSPGIGKTMFLFFLMAILVKAKKNTPFMTFVDGKCGFFNNGKFYKLKKSFIDSDELPGHQFFFFYDDATPPPIFHTKATAVMTSTSKKDLYKTFSKNG